MGIIIPKRLNDHLLKEPSWNFWVPAKPTPTGICGSPSITQNTTTGPAGGFHLTGIALCSSRDA